MVLQKQQIYTPLSHAVAELDFDPLLMSTSCPCFCSQKNRGQCQACAQYGATQEGKQFVLEYIVLVYERDFAPDPIKKLILSSQTMFTTLF